MNEQREQWRKEQENEDVGSEQHWLRLSCKEQLAVRNTADREILRKPNVFVTEARCLDAGNLWQTAHFYIARTHACF